MNWHIRFSQQAIWTHDLRQYLYTRARLSNARRVLDVGCGTGALLGELRDQPSGVFGLDIDLTHLSQARRTTANEKLLCSDAHWLPYPTHAFDITFCHFVLLWVNDPVQVVREMARVTRPGGTVLALAEPDYGGRVDFPPELSILGDLQSASLRQQGADPLIGRKLASIFHQAGLKDVETGVLGGQWNPASPGDWELEWQVLVNDLMQMSKAGQTSDIAKFYALEQQARQRGERVLFVPTFWALGKA